MTLAWLQAWWRCFGDRQELLLLIVEDEVGPCAIAPLALAHRPGYRALELIGTGALWGAGAGLADRTDFILARRHQESVEAILGYLMQISQRWDLLDLRGLPEEGSSAKTLNLIGPQLGFRLLSQPRWRSPYLKLEGSHREYLKQKGRSHRKDLRRKQRRLERLGSMNLVEDLSLEDPDWAIDRAVGIARRSWKWSQGTALLQRAPMRRFFRELLSQKAAGLFIAELRAGLRPVAYELGFQHAGILWSYDCAFDASCASASPGMLLSTQLIQRAYEWGLEEYDFLRGEEPYKARWQNGVRQEMEFVLDLGGSRARLMRLLSFHARWRLAKSPDLVWLKTRATGLLNRRA